MVDELEIGKVMRESGCDRDDAVRALRSNGNVYDAVWVRDVALGEQPAHTHPVCAGVDSDMTTCVGRLLLCQRHHSHSRGGCTGHMMLAKLRTSRGQQRAIGL